MSDFLTSDEIAKYRKQFKRGKPYTQEEIDALPFDGECDFDRWLATIAEDVLTSYGIPLTEETE